VLCAHEQVDVEMMKASGFRIESSGVSNSAQFDPWNIAMPIAFSVHL
jgi:hypothetical protein